MRELICILMCLVTLVGCGVLIILKISEMNYISLFLFTNLLFYDNMEP